MASGWQPEIEKAGEARRRSEVDMEEASQEIAHGDAAAAAVDMIEELATKWPRSARVSTQRIRVTKDG